MVAFTQYALKALNGLLQHVPMCR